MGPAGRVLDDALEDAGVAPSEVYVTNAVTHFKWEQRGKRRIHKRPSATEAQACHTWLEHEVGLVRPRAVVCLGATAARAVLGRPATISSVRGRVLDGPGDVPVVVTIHPPPCSAPPTRPGPAGASCPTSPWPATPPDPTDQAPGR